MKKQKVLSFILSFTLMVSVFALNFTAVFAATTTLSQIDAKSVEFRINSKYSLQGTTQGRYLTGGVPPVRFSM